MTIATETRRAGAYAGDDSTQVFAFSFKTFSQSDLVVVTTDTGVDTVKTLTTHYTVSLNADQDASPGGSITMLVAPATGISLTILSARAYLQSLNLQNAGAMLPANLNSALDNIVIGLQQIVDDMERMPRGALSDDVMARLPAASLRANGMFGFDASGDPTVLSSTAFDSLVALAADIEALADIAASIVIVADADVDIGIVAADLSGDNNIGTVATAINAGTINNLLDGQVGKVDTLAALKALSPADGLITYMAGYFAAGDGGHGYYKFTLGGAGSGNDMTIVDVTDASGYFSLIIEDSGVDVRQIGVVPNTRTLAQSRLNARAIEGWATLANGIALKEGRSASADIFWLAPPVALTNGASVGQTGCVKLTSSLTINGSRTGAWFRQFDDQFCSLFVLYPGAELRANNCRFDQWSIDRGDASGANYAASVAVTDTTLSGTGSDAVVAIMIGIIHGFGGDYYGFNCEYTNAVYGDVVPDARSRGTIMSDLFGYHHDTYSCLHTLGNVSTSYQADATVLMYGRVVMDHGIHEDVLTEVFDIGGGIDDLSLCFNRGTRCYTFTANPSHKEVFDVQDVRSVTIIGNDFDLAADCGTLIRMKGGKNCSGVVSGNKGRNGLAGAVQVISFANNGSGKLRVNTGAVHGGTTGETWVLMGAQTDSFSVSGAITVIDTDTFDLTGVTYTGSETALRSEIRAVPAPIEYVSSATGDYTLDTGVAFTTTELRWNGTAGTIKALQTANTANGGFDLGDAEATDPLNSRSFLMTVTVTNMTTGTLTVSVGGTGAYGDAEVSSDPISANGTYTFLMESNGADELAYIGEGSFDGYVEVTDCSMIEWQGAFIVHSNTEGYTISDNVGLFFFDGLHSLDQGNKSGQDCSMHNNRFSGLLNDGIIATHYSNYADLGAIFDKRLSYNGNQFRGVYRNAINLSGSTDTTISGGSFHTVGNGVNSIVFNAGCSDVLVHGVHFHNGVALTFDTNLTDETLEILDCPGFVATVKGRFDGTTLSNGKTVISRTACTYTAVDATEAAKVYRAYASLYTTTWTAAGNNPFAIHQDAGNIAANADVRFILFDELGAICNTKAAKFNWVLEGPTKFPVP
jgi:hypothetical protein